MYHLITLALASAFSVSALVVPRATQPADWDTPRLESYDTYHTRYVALACNSKHSTAFFDQCCHPLLAAAKLSSRPAQCTPSTKVSAAVPSNNDDGDDDCDDGDDGDDTYSTPSPVPSQEPAAPAKSSPAKSSSAPAPAKTPAPKQATPAAAQPAAASGLNSGGFATFFYQNGVAGACGTVHQDGDLIAAIDADRYGNTGQKSSLCGKKVTLTNTKNNKSVTVTIADACPTCKNSNSIDLSVGAFQKIATLDEGMVPITWSFS